MLETSLPVTSTGTDAGTSSLNSPVDRRSLAVRPDFIWGVSTSSYQIEGAAREDGRGQSIWDTYCRQVGKVANGDTGDVACDHYHRFAEDIALMRDLGVGAYRFSVAWPRILPHGRGAPNDKGLAFYDRLIDALLAAGIEPWLCLYHWDLPQDLDDLGGWTKRDCAGWFADYAALVARRYGDRVKRFATFNEPSIFTLFGYWLGVQAPGLRDRVAYHKAIHHVNLAHGAAVDAVRDLAGEPSIGAIHNRQPCLAATDEPADHAAALQLDAYWNRAFPDPQLLACYPPALTQAIEPHQQPGDLARICRPVDWFGLNHYAPNYAKADPGESPRPIPSGSSRPKLTIWFAWNPTTGSAPSVSTTPTSAKSAMRRFCASWPDFRPRRTRPLSGKHGPLRSLAGPMSRCAAGRLI